MTDALRLAVGTLTRLPTRRPRTVDRRTAGRAMLLAPLTAVPPAVLLVLLHLVVAKAWLPADLAAALAVAAVAWWSRGLHLDGLADTADGLAAAYNRDRALDVMRRSDIGPTGVVTLVLVLLVQVTALSALISSREGSSLAVVALLASRQVLGLACRHRVPAARPDGLGATVAGSVPTAVAVASTVVMVVVGSGLGWFLGAAWYAGALVVVAAALGTWAVVETAQRRVGGITGDVLGAVVEVALTAGLVVAVVIAAAAG
ncbi:MAG TPA: adenosylcobinamide-GDP ribazoletransferase [Lapillicoccus sp.]|nr:adenosylcobinamide-GDP ribazoletransferase [Lapillicoccus sp.]